MVKKQMLVAALLLGVSVANPVPGNEVEPLDKRTDVSHDLTTHTHKHARTHTYPVSSHTSTFKKQKKLRELTNALLRPSPQTLSSPRERTTKTIARTGAVGVVVTTGVVVGAITAGAMVGVKAGVS
jgi:hypothetical protein